MSVEWVDVIAIDSIEPNDVTPIAVGRLQLALYDAKDGLYATDGLCTHVGAPLCDGYFEGHTIECPLHQGGFDIRTGKALYTPVTKDLNTYPVEVRNGRVWLQLPSGKL